MTDDALIFFDSPAAFRAWLHAHHAQSKALVVGFHKKATGKPTLTWPESVDAALCYGWIDGIRRSHDASSYTVRFTPRKATSIWSAVNIRKIAEQRAAGLMTPAGEAAFARRDPAKSEVYSFERQAKGLDAAQERAFTRRAKAWTFWNAQRPSYRKAAAHWVTSAKREETRASRLATLIACSAKARWIPQMAVAQPVKTKPPASPKATRAAKKGGSPTTRKKRS